MSLHPDYKDILAEFAAHGVEYLLVGGYAVACSLLLLLIHACTPECVEEACSDANRSQAHGSLAQGIALLLWVCGCGTSALRSGSFDDRKGAAHVWAGSRSEHASPKREGADNLCLIEVRDAVGVVVIGPILERFDERPLALNPGRYELTLGQCRYICGGEATFKFSLSAVGGHSYQVTLQELNLNEASVTTAYLSDEATGVPISKDETWCRADF